MTERDIAKYKRKLAAKRKEILAEYPTTRLNILVFDCRGEDETAQSDVDIWVGIEFINGQSSTRQSVEDALQRINDGTYGICPECEEDIAAKRLNAMPWAKYCVACQEKATETDNDAPQPATGHFRPTRRGKQDNKR
jgi:DnaK suppressor protein